MKSIPYFTRQSYGVSRLYIANNELARLVATLTRRKTVENTDLLALQEMGFSLVQVADPSLPALAPVGWRSV